MMALTQKQIQQVRQATRAVESVDLHALEKVTTPDSYGRPAVAFGKPVDSAGVATDFAGGTLIWLDPCEQDGTDIPGLSLVHCHLTADKRFVSVAFLKTAVVRFAWYPVPETGSDQANGIVLGLADDSVSFGKPTADFTTGATITLDPCDQAGTDIANGVNVICHIVADKSTVGMLHIKTTDIVRFARYAVPDAGGVGGVVLSPPFHGTNATPYTGGGPGNGWVWDRAAPPAGTDGVIVWAYYFSYRLKMTYDNFGMLAKAEYFYP